MKKSVFCSVVLFSLISTVSIYANCNSDESTEIIFKKGWSKEDFFKFCRDRNNVKENIRWVTPNKNTCLKYNGKVENNECNAQWIASQNICYAIGARLPTRAELEQVIIDCGGKFGDRNNQTISYKACYKAKGFNPKVYQSSTEKIFDTSFSWSINLLDASSLWGPKYLEGSIRCVKN